MQNRIFSIYNKRIIYIMELKTYDFSYKNDSGENKEVKDVRTEIIRKLINEKAPSMKAFAESVNLPYTTLRSMLERGIGNASVDNVLKVCKGLNITTDQLEKMANDEDYEIETIAAHHDGEEWTEEELEEIERFKEFVRARRSRD